jgi:hypothetical protein
LIRWTSVLPLGALAAAGVYALAVDLSIPHRVPSTADWAEVAGAIRARSRPGDAVQIWPAWAERARAFIDSTEVYTDEDFAAADYPGASRLWFVSLPSAPNGRVDRARDALRSRGAAPMAPAERFGALALEPWDLRAPPLATDLTALLGPRQHHEVDYVPRRCAGVPVGPPQAPARLRAAGDAGTALHVRAGIVDGPAYDRLRPPVAVTIAIDGERRQLAVAPVDEPRAAWFRLDEPVPPGPPRRDFAFEVSSPDPAGRWLCLQAWTTR